MSNPKEQNETHTIHGVTLTTDNLEKLSTVLGSLPTKSERNASFMRIFAFITTELTNKVNNSDGKYKPLIITDDDVYDLHLISDFITSLGDA